MQRSIGDYYILFLDLFYSNFTLHITIWEVHIHDLIDVDNAYKPHDHISTLTSHYINHIKLYFELGFTKHNFAGLVILSTFIIESHTNCHTNHPKFQTTQISTCIFINSLNNIFLINSILVTYPHNISTPLIYQDMP